MSITDVVVDIETLGTRPGDSIVQIGAVAFNVGTPDSETLPESETREAEMTSRKQCT